MKFFMQNKIIIWLIHLAFLICNFSCIEEYKITIDPSDTAKYVVFGNITTLQSNQTIQISYSSGIESPEYIPVNNCKVEISDNKGNVFETSESNNGIYNVLIPQEYLNPGTAYKIDITTPNGEQITSDYDTLYQCANLDSIYYTRENLPSNDITKHFEKIQFFLDMKGLPEHSKHYIFTIEETWEYHTRHLKEWYYDGITLTHIEPSDASTHICWETQMVPDIFILSTRYLSENSYSKFPLHFVTNQTQKLVYGYSIKVLQHATSKSTFNHFRKLKNNISSEGGLYIKQPEQVKGNLHNLTNPDNEVLGYFFASSTNSKRIFVEKLKDMEFHYYDRCLETTLKFGVRSISRSDIPTYLLNGQSIMLSDHCVDCTLSGGTTTKPEFWPN